MFVRLLKLDSLFIIFVLLTFNVFRSKYLFLQAQLQNWEQEKALLEEQLEITNDKVFLCLLV